MILRQLFRPKWKHPRAEVRVRAVQRLEEGDPVLLQLAREDPDALVRKSALERVSDLAVLQQIQVWDAEQTLREGASQRLCRLLSGSHNGGPSLPERIAALEHVSDAKVLGYLIVEGVEAELRRAVAANISDQELLARTALEDADPGVRLKALDGVKDAQMLEQIFRRAAPTPRESRSLRAHFEVLWRVALAPPPRAPLPHHA